MATTRVPPPIPSRSTLRKNTPPSDSEAPSSPSSGLGSSSSGASRGGVSGLVSAFDPKLSLKSSGSRTGSLVGGSQPVGSSTRPMLEKSNSATPLSPTHRLPGSLNQTAPGVLPHHPRPHHLGNGNGNGSGTPPYARPVSMAVGPVVIPSSPPPVASPSPYSPSSGPGSKFTPPRPPPRTRPISVMPGLLASMPASYRSPSSSLNNSSTSSTTVSSPSPASSSSASTSSSASATTSSSSSASGSSSSAPSTLSQEMDALLATPPTTPAPQAPSFPSPLSEQGLQELPPPTTPPPPPPSLEAADSSGVVSRGAALGYASNGRLIPTSDGHSLLFPAGGVPSADESMLYQTDSLDEWREAEEDIGIEGAEWGVATERSLDSSNEHGVPGLPLDMDNDEWEFEEITEETEAEEEPIIPFSPRLRSNNYPPIHPAAPPSAENNADDVISTAPPIPPLPLSALQHHANAGASAKSPNHLQHGSGSASVPSSPSHEASLAPPLLRPASTQLPPGGSPATRELINNAARLARPFSTPGNIAPVSLSSSLPALPHYSSGGSGARPIPPPRATKPVLTVPDERKSHVQATIRSSDLNAMLERKLEAGPLPPHHGVNAAAAAESEESDREREREEKEREEREKEREKEDSKKKKEKDAQPEKKKFWQGTMRSKDKKGSTREEDDKEKEEREKHKEKEKEKEREAKEREAKEREERERQKEENKEKRMTFVGKKFRVTRKKKPESSKPSKDKKPSSGSIIISAPAGAQHRLHVDFDFQWTGSDPASEFKLIAKLGQGAYGKVYKAEHKDTGFILAIKCIPIPEELAEDAEKARLHDCGSSDIDTLRKEIGVLKKCRCESIVSYFGVCFRNSSLWIMMESCDMGSLTDVLNVVGHDKVSEVDMAYILREVVKGLIYLHSINIAHRDMKAANVLLTKTGQPKIADFGTSVQLQNATKGAQTFTGTPLFMSPEALSEESYGVKADIWSLGITAIQIADGKPPLADMNVGRAMLAIIHGSSPTLKEPKKWSKEFNDFLAVCLRKSPDDRPEAEDLLKHPFLMNAKDVHVLSFLKEYRLKVRDRPALERTFSFIQQNDRQWRQSHSPSAELIKQSILADSSKQGVQRVSQDIGTVLSANSAGIPNSPLNAPPSPYASLSSSPTTSAAGSASTSPPTALRHPGQPSPAPAHAGGPSPPTSVTAVGPPEIDLHSTTQSKPIDIGSPGPERRLSPLTRVNTADQRRASIAPDSEIRRLSFGKEGASARPSTTYGHMTPIVLDPNDRPCSQTSSGESGLGSKKSFHSQLSAKLDKKAEDEKKSRPSLSRPKSDRALQRQVLDSKSSTLRDTKTKDKAEAEKSNTMELRNSSEDVRRRQNDSDEPALDAALQNTERLEDLVGILKDLLAKERLRVREASDEICKWKKIANDLQRELDDLKLGLELNPPS